MVVRERHHLLAGTGHLDRSVGSGLWVRVLIQEIRARVEAGDHISIRVPGRESAVPFVTDSF